MNNLMGKVSGNTHTQQQLNNYANQRNSNNSAYRANNNNHANQLNPNNQASKGSNPDHINKASLIYGLALLLR